VKAGNAGFSGLSDPMAAAAFLPCREVVGIVRDSRARSLRTREGAASAIAGSARLAAVGAAFFVVSDTLLAWNRFGGGIPLASLWVLATYFIAQWYIARSVDLQAGGN
jgi:hypothetical protein